MVLHLLQATTPLLQLQVMEEVLQAIPEMIMAIKIPATRQALVIRDPILDPLTA